MTNLATVGAFAQQNPLPPIPPGFELVPDEPKTAAPKQMEADHPPIPPGFELVEDGPRPSPKLSSQLLNEAGADFLRGAGKEVTDLGGLADLGSAALKGAAGAPLALWDWATGDRNKAEDVARVVSEGTGAPALGRLANAGVLPLPKTDSPLTRIGPGYDPAVDLTAFGLNASTFGQSRNALNPGVSGPPRTANVLEHARFGANQLSLGGSDAGLAGVRKLTSKIKSVATEQAARAASPRALADVLEATGSVADDIKSGAFNAVITILRKSGVPSDRINAGLASLIPLAEQSGGRNLRLFQLLGKEFGEEFPQVVDNLATVLRERRLSVKAGDASPSIVHEATKEMRDTQVPFLQESGRRNLGEEGLFAKEGAAKAEMGRLVEEGYKPILNTTIPVKGQLAIAEVLNDPATQPYLKALEQDALENKTTVGRMIAENPVAAAHWIQSKARKVAESNPDLRRTATIRREKILDVLEKNVPGYRETRLKYGDQAGAVDAADLGQNFMAATRNEYSLENVLATYNGLSEVQKPVGLASIWNAIQAPLRGSQAEAPARLAQLNSIGMFDALEKLGPKGKALADDIRAVAAENRDLNRFAPTGESATMTNKQAVDEGRKLYSRGLPTWVESGLSDVAAMGSGLVHAPVFSLLRGGAEAAGKVGRPFHSTREDMTRLLMTPQRSRNALAEQTPSGQPPSGGNINALSEPPPPIGGKGGPQSTVKGPPQGGPSSLEKPARLADLLASPQKRLERGRSAEITNYTFNDKPVRSYKFDNTGKTDVRFYSGNRRADPVTVEFSALGLERGNVKPRDLEDVWADVLSAVERDASVEHPARYSLHAEGPHIAKFHDFMFSRIKMDGYYLAKTDTGYDIVRGYKPSEAPNVLSEPSSKPPAPRENVLRGPPVDATAKQRRFETSNGNRYVVEFDTETGNPGRPLETFVHFKEDRGIRQTTGKEYTGSGAASVVEAREVLRKVQDAIEKDIAEGGRTTYVLGNNDPRKDRIYAALAAKAKPPEGYEIATEAMGGHNYVVIRRTKSAPPTNALGLPTTRTKLNTKTAIKDAPKEYRDAVMIAPEGISQENVLRGPPGKKKLGERFDDFMVNTLGMQKPWLDDLERLKAISERYKTDPKGAREEARASLVQSVPSMDEMAVRDVAVRQGVDHFGPIKDVRQRVIDALKRPLSEVNALGPPTKSTPLEGAYGRGEFKPEAKARFNTRAAIKDAPKEYRDAVMIAPEGISQRTWDAVRGSVGPGRLPGPYTLGNRIEALERKPGLSAEDLRTLKAMKEMKSRLEKLKIDFE